MQDLDENVHKHTQISTRVHIYIQQSRARYQVSYLHLVEICAIIIQLLTQSRRVMYDDYDLDYTYSNDYGQDLDEYARDADIDEEYTRDGQDYETLAYRHYA